MNLSLLDWKLNSPRLDTIEISLLENSPGPSVAPLRSPGSSTKVKKVVDRDKSYPPQLTPTERASESKQSNRDALTETSKSPAVSGLNVSSKKVNDIRSLYIANLVRQIEANKIYPHMAKKLRQSGKVVVMLEILKNGNITAKTIIEECPHKLLNEAALRLVANLKSTSPIPDELQLDSWQVVIPIAYVLR